MHLSDRMQGMMGRFSDLLELMQTLDTGLMASKKF
jgi:hypothetical protein